jgi:biotin carboxyl carrier protein
LQFLTACGDSQKKESEDGHNHDPKTEEKADTGHGDEHGAEEGSATVAALTPEQIEAVGIKYGVVEMKELTATIKANGILSLPNSSKANATSLYGGVIKSINVQIGDYVRKGQVIATIANPQFIQLQEEYLTINSKITLPNRKCKDKRIEHGQCRSIEKPAKRHRRTQCVENTEILFASADTANGHQSKFGQQQLP